jgi:thiamine kinase-like enzyme
MRNLLIKARNNIKKNDQMGCTIGFERFNQRNVKKWLTDPKKIKGINLWNAIEPKDNISFANPFAKGCVDDHKNAILRMDDLYAQLVSLKKQRIVHMDLHSGNIMLEERKLSIDEMNAKIAAMRKEKWK